MSPFSVVRLLTSTQSLGVSSVAPAERLWRSEYAGVDLLRENILSMGYVVRVHLPADQPAPLPTGENAVSGSPALLCVYSKFM